MEMHNQEVYQESELEGFYPINQLASLHLTTAPSTTTTTTNHHYTSSGKSVKRRSPSDSDSADSERKSKKAMVVQDYHHSPPLGFTKIDLPISFPIIPSNNPQPPSSPVLRRSFSDVYNFPSPDSVAGSVETSAANAAIGVNSTIASPLFPVLQRSASDPIPLASLTRSNSQSASSGEMVVGFPVHVDTIKEESPNMKKLRRMKDLMREMNQWLDEVIREGDDDNSGVVTARQDEGEEEVSVERLGECTSINFKCPCSRGCQILISGRECYYKLI